MSLYSHHIHFRKRVQRQSGAIEQVDSKKLFLDRLVVVLGVLNIFATLPQVLEIWLDKDASGVSVYSWAYYTFFASILLLYGFVHKEKPIIATYLGSVLLYAAITIGAIIY